MGRVELVEQVIVLLEFALVDALNARNADVGRSSEYLSKVCQHVEEILDLYVEHLSDGGDKC
jgi:hypothetical protein